jgi:hypothetical protein
MQKKTQGAENWKQMFLSEVCVLVEDGSDSDRIPYNERKQRRKVTQSNQCILKEQVKIMKAFIVLTVRYSYKV